MVSLPARDWRASRTVALVLTYRRPLRRRDHWSWPRPFAHQNRAAADLLSRRRLELVIVRCRQMSWPTVRPWGLPHDKVDSPRRSAASRSTGCPRGSLATTRALVAGRCVRPRAVTIPQRLDAAY